MFESLSPIVLIDTEPEWGNRCAAMAYLASWETETLPNIPGIPMYSWNFRKKMLAPMNTNYHEW